MSLCHPVGVCVRETRCLQCKVSTCCITFCILKLKKGVGGFGVDWDWTGVWRKPYTVRFDVHICYGRQVRFNPCYMSHMCVHTSHICVNTAHVRDVWIRHTYVCMFVLDIKLRSIRVIHCHRYIYQLFIINIWVIYVFMTIYDNT